MGNSFSEAIKKRFSSTIKDTTGQEEKPLKMWCSQTSAHGVFDLYTSKHLCSFIFWAFLIVGCFAMAVYQIRTLLVEFDARPHFDTTLDLNSSAIDWPNVTVCNLNRANLKAQERVKIGSKPLTWLLGSPMLPYEYQLWHEELQEYQQEWEQFLENQTTSKMKTVDGLFRALGNHCWETFMEMGCRFGTQKFQCCKYAKEVLNREFGRCWSITPPPNPGYEKPQQDVPGSSYGLRLYINPRVEEYLSKEHILNNYLSRGIVVSIDYNPYRLAFANPIFVTPGKQAKITLKASVHQYSLPTVRMYESECVERGSMELKILKGDYDKQNCYFDCVQEESLYQCGCILLSEHKTNYSVCNTTDLYRCFNSTDFGALKLHSQRFEQGCTSKCLPICEAKREIQAFSSLSDYPEPKFYQPIRERFVKLLYRGRDPNTVSEWRRRFLEKLADKRAVAIKEQIYLNIYFPERGYSMINRKEKISVFQLIANIGGQTGLWLGASFITLVQAVYYCAFGTFRSVYNSRIKEKMKKSVANATKTWSKPRGETNKIHGNSAQRKQNSVKRF